MTSKINDISPPLEKKGYLLRFGVKAVIEVIEREMVKQRETELCSNQQEADTKIFLGAKFVSTRGCNNVSIHTVNSDVAILALYYAPMLSNPSYTKIGAGKNENTLNLTEVASENFF